MTAMHGSHGHHDHAHGAHAHKAHAHPAHGHHAPAGAPVLGAPSLSLLRMGAGQRLAGAGAIALVLWALVALVMA